jgi:Ca2+-binding RTX toxin-like protein
VDQSFGGEGDDDLWALARGDVDPAATPDAPDTVGDSLHGDAGNDRFHVRDGEKDTVECGEGQDRVSADRLDEVGADCERVNRADPRPVEEGDEGDAESDIG